MPFRAGDVPFRAGDVPFRAGDVPFRAGDVPFRAGDVPFRAGDVPFRAGDVPFRAGDVPFPVVPGRTEPRGTARSPFPTGAVNTSFNLSTWENINVTQSFASDCMHALGPGVCRHGPGGKPIRGSEPPLDPIMGEFEGTLTLDGAAEKAEAKVIADEDHKYRIVLLSPPCNAKAVPIEGIGKNTAASLTGTHTMAAAGGAGLPRSASRSPARARTGPSP